MLGGSVQRKLGDLEERGRTTMMWIYMQEQEEDQAQIAQWKEAGRGAVPAVALINYGRWCDGVRAGAVSRVCRI